jgi:hypothetical protein
VYHETKGEGVGYIWEGVSLCLRYSGASFLCVHAELSCIVTRETREWWPLIIVKTEVNGDSKITNERGPSLVGSLGSLCQCKIFLSSLGCSSRPSTTYIFLPVNYFNSFVPVAQQARQAVVLGRLSLNVSNLLKGAQV